VSGTTQAPAATPLGLRPPELLSAIAPLRPGTTIPDVIVVDVSLRKAYVFLADGDGVLNAPSTFTVGASGATLTAIAVRDLNGDGKADIALADAAHNSVTVLPGNGTGAFGAPTSTSLGASNVSPGSIAV